ncbi:MAG: MBL fold metallo-hydrolase [Chloroflexi bacterium]|nr:MBL fold metallo-hydrolase [Chloroflexota bacterium]
MFVQEGIYQATVPVGFPLETVHCYLLVGGDDAYLVDTAWRPNDGHDHLLALFQEAGVEPRQLNGIILTHGHRDHAGHLAALNELTDAPVLVHPAEEPIYNPLVGPAMQRALGDWFARHGVPAEVATGIVGLPRYLQMPVAPMRSPRWLADGDVIPVGSMRWEVIWTPGHTPGHVCLYERQLGLLITGDHVLPHETPNVSARPTLPPNPLGRYVDSLRRLQPLDVRKALPAHGDVFTNVQSILAHLISHHDVRLADVLAALQSGPRSTFEVAAAIPWVQRSMRFMDLAPFDRFLAFGETIAHLECLEGSGEVRRLASEPPVLWRLAGA